MIITNNPLSVSIPGSYDITVLVVVLADYTYVYTGRRISSFTISFDLLKGYCSFKRQKKIYWEKLKLRRGIAFKASTKFETHTLAFTLKNKGALTLVLRMVLLL